MIARCANPDCTSTFRMWEGKVYHFDRKIVDEHGNPNLVTDHYWLCGNCAPSLVLEVAEEGLVLKTAPRVEEPELTTA